MLSFLNIAPDILSPVKYDEERGYYYYDSIRTKVVKEDITRNAGRESRELYQLFWKMERIIRNYGLSYPDVHLGNIGLLGNHIVIIDSGGLQ